MMTMLQGKYSALTALLNALSITTKHQINLLAKLLIILSTPISSPFYSTANFSLSTLHPNVIPMKMGI
jgi:hypothetical protein